ncbi:hypothetical protein Tco_1429174 [Tanacetum coccineum]
MNTKVEFRIDLVHGATSVAKSPYRLAPLEMQKLSEQLQELQDKVLELLRKEKLYAKFTKSEAVKNWEKGRVKLRRVRAMSMTIQSDVKDKILATPSETSKTLEDIMRACVIDFGGSYQLSIRCVPFEALHGRKCRSPVIWAEIGGSSLIGPELVQETTNKVVLLMEKPKAAGDRQKSYDDNRRKPLVFKGKLAPRYVGPFEILERIGPVAYRLRLPEELSGVHDTFHVSNLKKCQADASLHVPLDELRSIWARSKVFRTSGKLSIHTCSLSMESLGVLVEVGRADSSKTLGLVTTYNLVSRQFLFDELRDRVVNDAVTQYKAKLLAVRYLVKVSWNSKGNFELTWVWEDYLKDKYPRLIVWLVKPLVLTYESVVMYGLCVYMRYVDCVRVGNQSIERDRLIGIGLVMDLVKFLSFTFGGKEMTFVVLAMTVSRHEWIVSSERDRLIAVDLIVSLLWIVDSERDRLILWIGIHSTSGNPTTSLDPILSTSSPSLTPFGGGDFILEEIKACLTNDSIPPGIDDADFDSEGDLLLLEKLLNDDPSTPLPLKELHFEEIKMIKSSIDDPPKLELKDLPSHLEYAFFEETDKLPVIIAKDFKR